MKLIVIALSILTIGSIGFSLYNYQQLNQVVVVDVVKVFNGFTMKRDLEAKTDVPLRNITQKGDSLVAIYNVVSKGDNKDAIISIQKQIEETRQQYGYALEQSNKYINEQVWKRLNILIDEFSKEKGYRIVIGANGMGSILYSKPGIDKTEEIIKYANEKYKTGN